MALEPLSQEDMRVLRSYVEKIKPDDQFIAVAVLTGAGEDNQLMALSVLAHQDFDQPEVEARFRVSFGGER